MKAARICQSRIFGAALQTPHGSTEGQMRVASDLDCATKFEFTDWMLRFAPHKVFENTLKLIRTIPFLDYTERHALADRWHRPQLGNQNGR
jgi:hypothetical protein